MSRAVVAAIPARFDSSRLPGKPLREIHGKPMIQRVYEQVRKAEGLDRIVVLTDDERIAEAVRGFRGEVEMTPAECASGTDRIAWAARDWDVDAVINVQGDEPLIDPDAISRVARHLSVSPDDAIVTLATAAEPADLDDPNAVKVVLDRDGYALYFSRAGIPYPRRSGIIPTWRHVGLYGYQLETLLELATLPPSPLELTESLEQLRALHHGISIRVLEVRSAMPGVDTEEDLRRIEALMEI
jgi:3-deoxy-manno-octulosonate cytidylyltransferase (CMP-KDO synthetase)